MVVPFYVSAELREAAYLFLSDGLQQLCVYSVHPLFFCLFVFFSLQLIIEVINGII